MSHVLDNNKSRVGVKIKVRNGSVVINSFVYFPFADYKKLNQSRLMHCYVTVGIKRNELLFVWISPMCKLMRITDKCFHSYSVCDANHSQVL